MTDAQPFDRRYWDDRYAAPGLAWSGDPNTVLVTEASALAPGRALDIGCGEGADALWLAARGWQVVGVDFSRIALDKARANAASVDPVAAARITWQQRDLTDWTPDRRCFDLVTAQFMHLPEPAQSRLFRALAATVAPGGILLIVGHDSGHGGHAGSEHQGHHPERMFTAGDVRAAIDGERLTIDVAEIRPRDARDPAGMRDVVVRASR